MTNINQWKVGDIISANKLNEMVNAINDLLQQEIPEIDTSNLITTEQLTTILAGYSDVGHTHNISEIVDLVLPTVPTKVSQLENDSDYATNASVDEKIANVATGGQVDLTSYAKKTDLPTRTSQLTNDSGYLTEVPSEYITEAELNAKGYLTKHQSLANYALKSEIPSVPTKTSQLENDSNFISSIPGEYVTEQELNAKGLATETFVTNKIAEASIGGGEGSAVDLSGLGADLSLNGQTLKLKNANGVEIGTGVTLPQASGDGSSNANINTLLNSASNLQPSSYNAKPIKPLISFVDDDGKAGVYTKWLPITQEKNVPINICIVTSMVGTLGYLTWEQIKELQNTYGYEILSHTVTHSNIGTHNTNKTWIEELKQSKVDLINHGLNVRGFAYPNGGYWGTKEGVVDGTSNGFWMTALFYDYGVTTGSTINTHPITTNMGIDRAGIGCYAAAAFSTLDNIKARVDECYEQNGWLIFMTHVDDAGHTDEDNQMLRDLIDYIKTKGIDIVTMSEGFEIFGNVIETPGCKITKQGAATLDVSADVPKATTSSTGVVQVGSGLNIVDGVISVDGNIYYDKTYLDNILDTIQNDIENLKNSGGGGGSTDSAPIISNIAAIKAAPNTNFDITYTVTDSDGIATHQMSYDGGINYSIIEPVAGENNTYTYTTQLSEEKNYNCKLKVTDTFGNSAITSFSIKIQYNRYIFDKVTTQGSAEVNNEEGIYKITDSAEYDNVMLYDTTGALTDTNKTYTLCIKTLTKDIVGEPNCEFTKTWILQGITMPKVNELVVGETIKKTFNISQAFTATERFCYLQFDKKGTGSVIEVQIWIES